MRGNLQWYKLLQDKELKQTEGQSEAVKQKELQRKIDELKAEITQLDSQISGAEEHLETQEQSISCTWAQVEDSHRRELLLQGFRQRCETSHKILSDDAQKITEHRQELEEMAKKAEIELLFDNKPSSSSEIDNLKSQAAAEAQVLRELRKLCDDRVRFYQSVQESELKTAHSSAKHMTREQRTNVFRYWLSAVENLLSVYPPSHVLLVLEHLARREQTELEEKVTQLDVTQEMSSLRFCFESNQLLDKSAQEGNVCPSLKALLQEAWEDVEQSLVELAQTRSNVEKLQHQLETHKKEAELEVSGTAEGLHNDTLALSTLNVEIQCVMRAAARDYIREWCTLCEQDARSRQTVLRNLQRQQQSILDFRQSMVLRQEDIRALIKGNSSAKAELVRLQAQLQEYIQCQLVPQFDEVATAANNIRNSISKEAKQMGMVSLLSLDCRTLDGMQRVPASWLSIHRSQSPSFSSLRQSLEFPLYKAPEHLCSQARSQQLELRFLHQILTLHLAAQQKMEKEAELLHASDQKALLSRVTEEDQKLLKTLLPRVRSLTQRCGQGLSYVVSVKTAISYWWEKPAQHVLPEVSKGGLTYQQWLERWRLTAKAF